MSHNGPDKPGDNDIFDVFAEDDANKARKDARPAKRRTKRRRLSAVSHGDPTPNCGTLDSQDGRSSQPSPAAAAVQHRRREGVARNDARNSPTSPIELASTATTPATTLGATGLEHLPGALVTDPNQEWGIRNIIGRKIVTGEVQYWVEWEPAWMLESELDGAQELGDEFEAKLQYAQVGSRQGRRKRPKTEDHLVIGRPDACGETVPKKWRGRPRKQK
jgi:hypothetical protein